MWLVNGRRYFSCPLKIFSVWSWRRIKMDTTIEFLTSNYSLLQNFSSLGQFYLKLRRHFFKANIRINMYVRIHAKTTWTLLPSFYYRKTAQLKIPAQSEYSTTFYSTRSYLKLNAYTKVQSFSDQVLRRCLQTVSASGDTSGKLPLCLPKSAALPIRWNIKTRSRWLIDFPPFQYRDLDIGRNHLTVTLQIAITQLLIIRLTSFSHRSYVSISSFKWDPTCFNRVICHRARLAQSQKRPQNDGFRFFTASKLIRFCNICTHFVVLTEI